jgi:hypothetical protein
LLAATTIGEKKCLVFQKQLGTFVVFKNARLHASLTLSEPEHWQMATVTSEAFVATTETVQRRTRRYLIKKKQKVTRIR